MTSPVAQRITLQSLRELAHAGRKFAMLTAYSYPIAAAAQAAGVHSLLIGDSLGTVLLGHENTRGVPLDLMITLGEAVRRGAPRVFFIGDMPYECIAGGARRVAEGSRRFADEAGCDAVKLEVRSDQADLIEAVRGQGVAAVAHLGLRPQSVLSPDGYRAQARDEPSIRALAEDARRMVDAGAEMILLEAVPNEASQAVVAAVDVPVVGCGAGPACHGHVIVTHDMLGIGAPRPPRFVPVLAQLRGEIESAMREYVRAIESREYPGPQHVYPMRGASAGASRPT